jgi:hypothetical protein
MAKVKLRIINPVVLTQGHMMTGQTVEVEEKEAVDLVEKYKVAEYLKVASIPKKEQKGDGK